MGIDNDEARTAGNNFPRKTDDALTTKNHLDLAKESLRRAEAAGEGRQMRTYHLSVAREHAELALQAITDAQTEQARWRVVQSEISISGWLLIRDPDAPAAATDGVHAYVKPTILNRPGP